MLRRTPLFFLATNYISLAGVVLVTTAGVLWLLLLPSRWRDDMSNPYVGILANMALPALFVLGLLLIPFGLFIHKRRQTAGGNPGPILPHGGELRKLAIFVGATTFVNLVIGSQLTMSAVSYMDSDQFCGQACHTVMTPEFTAYKKSPHAHVSCTSCHIGGGAPWFVKAKINGSRQLLALVMHTYERPISSPVQTLRPARDICEKCHSTQRFSGDMLLVKTHFSGDEHNTAATSVLLMHVGGQNWKGALGIHGAHSGWKGRIEYISSDGRRQIIPEVTYTSSDGKKTVYRSNEIKATPQQLTAGEHRAMDCVDCHNRPSHVFELPESAVDKAMVQERISPALPFIKKRAIAALRTDYPDRETAARQIDAALSVYYRKNYPGADSTTLKNAIEGVKTIYAQNIFPDMRVTWGVHPNNIGHTEFPGCFRCHDGNHAAEGGKTISNDCSTCHDLLAMEEKDPKILSSLGYKGGAAQEPLLQQSHGR